MKLFTFAFVALIPSAFAFSACSGDLYLGDRPDAASTDAASDRTAIGDARSPGDEPASSDASPGVGEGAFSWSQRAPLPIPRTGLGAAAVAGKVYAIGGYTGTMLSRVDAYDPASDTWTQKADLLTARRDFAIGVIEGKIYVAAGNSGDMNVAAHLSSTEVYDPQTDSWTALAPCPIPDALNDAYGNRFAGGGVFHDRLYVMFTVAGGVTPSMGCMRTIRRRARGRIS